MKYEEFDQQIREMIPQPSAAITDALYRMGVEALEDRPQDLLIAFEFISRYFSVDVLQGVYEIIQHGSAVLPNELVAAAVFLQAGDTSEHMAQMAKNGELMCFYSPREKGEISPLAICSVLEAGKKVNYFTIKFGKFTPKDILARAKRFAKQQGVSVTGALECISLEGEVSTGLYAARNVLARQWTKMTTALDTIFGTCPAVAARVTFDADRGHTAVEYNPLWQKAHMVHGQIAHREKQSKPFCRER